MDSIYYKIGDPAAFGGVKKLQNASKNSRDKVTDFLRRSDVYNQYNRARRNFIRRKIIAYKKHELWESDLADFQKLSRYNSGYRYVLCIIDVLSKFVFYIPIKSKKPEDVIAAFDIAFKVAKPKLLHRYGFRVRCKRCTKSP